MKARQFLIIFTLALSACTKEVVPIIVPEKSNETPNGRAQEVSGTINGGGGKGVLCQKNGQSTVEILDIYEAKVLYDLQPIVGPNSEAEAIDQITKILTRHFWHPDTGPIAEYQQSFHKTLVEKLLKKIRFIEAGKKLKLVNDSFEPLIQQNCEMVQIAVYYDESVILIDKTLWEKMDWVNRLGLLTHELLYWIARREGATNSVAVRKIVGQLLSTKGAKPKSDGVPTDETKLARCSWGQRKSYSFFAYESEKNGEKGVEIVYKTAFSGTDLLFRTSSFIKRFELNDLFREGIAAHAMLSVDVESYDELDEKVLLELKITGADQRTIAVFPRGDREGAETSPVRLACLPPAKKEGAQ